MKERNGERKEKEKKKRKSNQIHMVGKYLSLPLNTKCQIQSLRMKDDYSYSY